MLTLLGGIAWFHYLVPKLKAFLQPFREDGARHQHKLGTPTMGGLLILGAVLLRCIGSFSSPYWICLLCFGLLGLYDDSLKVWKHSSRGMTALQKLIIQCVIGVVLLSLMDLNTVVSMVGYQLDLGVWYYPFALFIIVATSNALNLTDGLDGLAATQALIILFYLSMYALNPTALIFIQALVIMLMIFLWYNWHPAQLFMGDVGSLAMGGFLGLMAIDLKVELYFILPALVMIMEVLSVILQVAFFKSGYGRIFKMAPLHHHFELSGFHERHIVIAFAVITIGMAGVARCLH